MSESIKILLLAVLQGITEFLPVSSSGHLALAEHFLKVNPPGITLEVALHLGTLLAVLVFYWRRLWELLRDLCRWTAEARLYVLALIVATIPAGVVGVLFNDWFESLTESPRLVAGCIMLTGLWLLSLRWARSKDQPLGFWRALGVGLAQAIAVAPGISRSGSTIGMARHLGIEPARAAEFSFFLMIPAVGGACLLKLTHKEAWQLGDMGPGTLIVAILVAAIVGYLSIAVLIRLLKSDRFWLFGLYCLAVGGISLWLLR